MSSIQTKEKYPEQLKDMELRISTLTKKYHCFVVHLQIIENQMWPRRRRRTSCRLTNHSENLVLHNSLNIEFCIQLMQMKLTIQQTIISPHDALGSKSRINASGRDRLNVTFW